MSGTFVLYLREKETDRQTDRDRQRERDREKLVLKKGSILKARK